MYVAYSDLYVNRFRLAKNDITTFGMPTLLTVVPRVTQRTDADVDDILVQTRSSVQTGLGGARVRC